MKLNPLQASLTTQIMLALVAGAGMGVLLHGLGLTMDGSGSLPAQLLAGGLDTVGSIFIASLKMLVVPLVLVSLVCGVTALSDIRQVGRIGIKALGLYLMTTAIAITIGITVALLVKPGQDFDLSDTAEFTTREAPPLSQVITDLVPTNPIQALAEGNMLQIIVFALLLGLAIILAGTRGQKVLDIFTSLNEVIMQMVVIVMKLAPLGVFCLIAMTFATQGLEAIWPLAGYFFSVLGALLVHAFVTLPVLMIFMARLNPLMFIKKMRNAMAFAFSTASSNATIPVTLRSVRDGLGVQSGVASFTVPLGATINMDGTAIMQGVATVFIATIYQVDLTLMDYLTVILTAVLASIGTAGVPGVGLIMLAMVLNQVGMPVEGIAFIIGVDRLLDMTRTAVNVLCDAVVSCIIARSEGALDIDVFDDAQAGLTPAIELDAHAVPDSGSDSGMVNER